MQTPYLTKKLSNFATSAGKVTQKNLFFDKEIMELARQEMNSEDSGEGIEGPNGDYIDIGI